MRLFCFSFDLVLLSPHVYVVLYINFKLGKFMFVCVDEKEKQNQLQITSGEHMFQFLCKHIYM